MIWMLDTNILVYLTNRKPGFETIARRMSGRSPGEVRLSAITLAELRFGIEKGEFRTQNKAALEGLLFDAFAPGPCVLWRQPIAMAGQKAKSKKNLIQQS